MMQSLLTHSIHSTALQGQKALVFGASSGLGNASAETLAAMGADVVMLARNKDKLALAADTLKAKASGNIITEAQDITDISRMQAILERHNDSDILVTNCGGPPVGVFENMDMDVWESAWQGQLRSAVQACKVLVPEMAKRGRGRVIMIASVTVIKPKQGFALSNSIRPGLKGLAATLTQEYASKGVTANLVCPGTTLTERIEKLVEQSISKEKGRQEILAEWGDGSPVKRLGKAEEIAAMVGFLASDASAYLTGQCLLIDGGESVEG